MNFESLSFPEPFDPHPIKVKLNNGKYANLESFHLSFTYAGLLEGTPGKETNQIIIDEIREFKVWGKRKIYSTVPREEDLKEILPLFSYFAWISSFATAKDPLSDGSELIIHRFEKSMEGKSIQLMIQSVVDQIDWENEAEDYLF
ncbi:hypothetical protein SAMN04488519_10914 [Algoriphagus ornithinivorans]|uniref:Uncharacterized protein n=1 Tax=Algoriphagus ornithinivorans TaxID=226506 RepID=A0A1I5IID6_9BACT|nr:hypothetical protein [Algoriphagus ornithinivorans]SFO60373.1 hypothetical protein SAMN04488519_10914 [Algoriphagus ornithinivorans]